MAAILSDNKVTDSFFSFAAHNHFHPLLPRVQVNCWWRPVGTVRAENRKALGSHDVWSDHTSSRVRLCISAGTDSITDNNSELIQYCQHTSQHRRCKAKESQSCWMLLLLEVCWSQKDDEQGVLRKQETKHCTHEVFWLWWFTPTIWLHTG